ncbi:Uncharacterized protein DAT39_011013 [Clarias magur]|uniref:Uncharacterized protein n=1 Tax=Clarias magur TaxID=1594786 RepID=A0A8J4X0J9_CLAMG|nr:Uncharacterized protein DAT39_011013 [Clarias magur]
MRGASLQGYRSLYNTGHGSSAEARQAAAPNGNYDSSPKCFGLVWMWTGVGNLD